MQAELDYIKNEGELVINFAGDFILYNDRILKDKIFSQINKKSVKKIMVKSDNLGKWDSSLVVILFELINISRNYSIGINYNELPEGVKSLLNLSFSVDRAPLTTKQNKVPFLDALGTKVLSMVRTCKDVVHFLGEILSSLGRFFTLRAIYRKVDFQFALENCGFKALSIVTLISYMVGLILAFVGAMQLQLFGAEIYVSSLVSIGMVRLMGALMTGIIMAGRTGASYAATIGTMQVNEEIDALKTMGVSEIDFLVLPRIIALMIMMPILTMFADIVGILGGATVSVFMLDLSPQEYFRMSIDILNFKHFIIGVLHGFVFGCVISACGCYQGIRCGKDADSVGKATTNAVVYSIIWIVITTSIITIICQVLHI